MGLIQSGLVTASLTISWLITLALVAHHIRHRRRIGEGEAETPRPAKNGGKKDDNSKELERSVGCRATLGQEMEERGGSFSVTPIGVVRSVYQLCVGTPRQGLLAPNSRGRIEFYATNNLDAATAIDGLEGFSHVWIVFVFHLNLVGKKVPAKIAPPALGGVKVGALATRSPHRFNPIGITLAKLDSIERRTVYNEHKKPVSVPCLRLSGIDLVDGTPVLDIKPYVAAYDAPPPDTNSYTTPAWVSKGLETRRHVIITDTAKSDLQRILLEHQNALEFYGGARESAEDASRNLLLCVEQVLAIDVRSQWQTKKARTNSSKAQRADRVKAQCDDSNEQSKECCCTQQIDNLMVSYIVKEAAMPARLTSKGSGAEDQVIVTGIQLLGKFQ
jgi:tRNA-Thr(GGU) m(6)t(6)A37 methyltransferase TsaA